MFNKIIVLATVVAICGFYQGKDRNDQSRARASNFVSGFGGIYREGELLVRFAPKADGKQRSAAEKDHVLTSLGGGIEKHTYKLVTGLSLVKLPPGRTVENVLRAFNNRAEIIYAEPNYRLELMADEPPNDPNWKDDSLWGLHNIAQNPYYIEDADIDAPEAWEIETDAHGIIVAVIDTGIFYEHEDLEGNMWVNQAELNGTTGVDDDNNGHTDDIRGWNFYDDSNNVTDEWESGGHGTYIAGIIGGKGNNAKGIVGVCWDVQIMNLRIFPTNWQYDADAVVSGAVEAIEYAVDKGARVISNAWGFYAAAT